MAANQCNDGALTRLVFLAAAALLVLAACTASETTLQGGVGEYCNGNNDDCRTELVCENYTCVYEDGYFDECADICDHLDSCQVNVESCHSKCVNTTRKWSEEPMDDFIGCFLEDLTCEELRESESPPKTCYRRLPLPEERDARCDEFEEAADECGADDEALDDLNDACGVMARTRSDEVWADTEPCVARLEDNVCPDILDCLDDTFKVSPPLSGDESNDGEGDNDIEETNATFNGEANFGDPG